MEAQEQTIEQLRLDVERTAGMRMQTNKDFDCLVASIYDKTHTKISATTLKRFWGYLSEDVAPSRFTLNLLSQYVGYEDFGTFCATLKPSEIEQPQLPAEDTIPAEPSEVKRPGYKRVGLALLVLLAIVLGIAFILPSLQGKTGGWLGKNTPDSARILQKGQVFATYDDFLPLFGITATESRHYQFVPGEEQIVVWSPQYHNPTYHNDGNPDSLMPTITEYWTPVTDDSKEAEELKEMVRQRQKESYYKFIGTKQVRVVFMKDLFDSTFVFLGVYRFDPLLSDTTKMVWIRAADQCNLDNIPFLKNYGNY